jgi:hypothetical protein
MSFHSGSFDLHVRQARNHGVPMLIFAGLLALGAVAVFHCFAPQASAALPAAPMGAQGDPQSIKFDGCTIFTAADAAQVLGVPVRIRPLGTVGCAYEAAKATSPGGWRRNTAVNIEKYKTASEEASAWSNQKIRRSLRPGRKNLTVLSGVGSEAYLQISPDHGAFDGEVWVHTNLSNFRLIETSEQPPSPDVLKVAAQKIAAKLP